MEKKQNQKQNKKILSHHITRLFELKMSLGNQTGPHGNWSEHNEKKEEGGVINTAISKSHGPQEETPGGTRANIGVLSTRLSICSQY